ncbi:hypothetical protein [Deferribacter abyssi]|uniref:hypothetical protein n=1 Tax=Deferribacter abyssi TaxID=213806 RepID=UPI003C232D3F
MSDFASKLLKDAVLTLTKTEKKTAVPIAEILNLISIRLGKFNSKVATVIC